MQLKLLINTVIADFMPSSGDYNKDKDKDDNNQKSRKR